MNIGFSVHIFALRRRLREGGIDTKLDDEGARPGDYEVSHIDASLSPLPCMPTLASCVWLHTRLARRPFFSRHPGHATTIERAVC